MPSITRLFIKASLLYLVVALFVGVLLVLRLLYDLPGIISGFSPIYFHLFMVGWVMQLIVGVAYWMFPKWSKEQPRGYDWLALTTFWLLNVGLLLRMAAEPALTVSRWGGWGWLIIVSAVLQWLAGLAFVINTWPRVKEK